MAGSKQFYMKFNVKDFRTDPKVCECNAGSVGVYIMLMCLLFDTESKGKHRLNSECLKTFAELLPRQNDRQINQQTPQQLFDICRCVAEHLAKHLPFTEKEVREGLHELLINNVLYLEGNFICQKRMIKDAKISEIRSKSGKAGADATNKKTKNPRKKPEADPNSKEVLPAVLPRQNQQQKSNYNYNYNSNSNSKGEIGEGNNIRGGTGEKNPGEREEVGEIADYENKWSFQMPTNYCKHFFFNHQAWSKAKDGALKVLSDYYRVDGDMEIAERMELLNERLALWADEYNDFLDRSGDKTPTGQTIKVMAGRDGWPNHFHNWLLAQKGRLAEMPNKRIDNQQVATASGSQSLITGSTSAQEQEEFYKRK